MTHRDRVGGSSGRRKGAGDAVHRQNFSTPSDRPHTRSLWVMISAPWYKGETADRLGAGHGGRRVRGRAGANRAHRKRSASRRRTRRARQGRCAIRSAPPDRAGAAIRPRVASRHRGWRATGGLERMRRMPVAPLFERHRRTHDGRSFRLPVLNDFKMDGTQRRPSRY